MYNDEISDETKRKYFEMNLTAAKTGLVESMSEVAGMYFKGFGVEKNVDEAIKWLKKAIEEGDESAAIALADIYCKDKNVEKAIFYYSKATDKNNICALGKLSEVYERQKDFEKMFECYQKGANLGNRSFMEKLGYCYLFGRGVPQDDFKALDWFIKIIESYDWNSFPFDNGIVRIVASIYNKHYKFSDKKFLKFYVTTEKLGIFNAMFGIATELYKTDKFRALKWFKKADIAGDFDAALAVHYILTELFEPYEAVYLDYYIKDNYSKACEWYKSSVAFGNINAAKNLMILELTGFKRYQSSWLPNVENSSYWLEKVLELEKEANAETLNFDEIEIYLRTKIIGVGDFGAEMVNYSLANNLKAEFAVVAAKNEPLLKSSAPQRLKLSDTTDEDTKNNLSELVKGLDVLFIFTDLTDENISGQIAKLSKSYLTVAIVPNSAPNKEKFQNLVDSLISVEDNNIFLTYSAVRCINNLANEPLLVGLDFADVQNLLKNNGKGYVTYAKAAGETAEVDAMKYAVNSAKDILSKSKGILCYIFGSTENISMMAVNEAVILLEEAAHPEAEILWSVSTDVISTDFVEVILITTDSVQ